MEALRRELISIARRLVAFFFQVPEAVVDMLDQTAEPSVLLYALASNARLEVAQEVLAAERLSLLAPG
jgi:hypothetical protein